MQRLAAVMAVCLSFIVVAGIAFFPWSEEEPPQEESEEVELADPDECVLVCEGSIIQKGSCILCKPTSGRRWSSIPMCPDWREYYPSPAKGMTCGAYTY